MRKFALYLVVLSGLGFMSSCGGDDGGTDINGGDGTTGSLSKSTKDMLYDKIWYSTNPTGGIDHEFLSDGTLRQAQSLDGRWTWQNNGDTMNLVDHMGNRYDYLFMSIGSNSMSFKSSVDGYQSVHGFKDTE
jgi:hypothetical protein